MLITFYIINYLKLKVKTTEYMVYIISNVKKIEWKMFEDYFDSSEICMMFLISFF